MLNNSSTKLVMVLCAILSLINVAVDGSTLFRIIFIAGFLYHAIDYYFIRDIPASLRTMKELIQEEYSYLTRTHVLEIKAYIDEYINANLAFNEICRVNCMEAGKNITKLKFTEHVDGAKSVMKYGEEALLSNCRVLYSRLKIIRLRRSMNEEDKLYIQKYNDKNKEILKNIEKLLSEMGELNKGNYDVINIKDYVEALRTLNEK